jgi:DNA-binding response OmpR family regulator
MDLHDIIEEATPSVIVVKETVAAAEKVLDEPFDPALLDIDLTDGKSYDIASTHARKSVPFVPVSAMSADQIPLSLYSSRIVTKPFPEQIKQVVLAAKDRKPFD